MYVYVYIYIYIYIYTHTYEGHGAALQDRAGGQTHQLTVPFTKHKTIISNINITHI